MQLKRKHVTVSQCERCLTCMLCVRICAAFSRLDLIMLVPMCLLQNAFAVVRGLQLSSFTQASVLDFRKFALQRIFSAAGPEPARQLSCDMPGCSEHSTQKSVCCVCGRWSHWKLCAKLRKRPSCDFVCTICTAQYGDH